MARGCSLSREVEAEGSPEPFYYYFAGVHMRELSTPVSALPEALSFSAGCGRRPFAVLPLLTKESLATSTTLGLWATCSFCSWVPGAGAASADAATTHTHSGSIAGRDVQTRSLSWSPLDCLPATSRDRTLN